jgi:hypothetical protein
VSVEQPSSSATSETEKAIGAAWAVGMVDPPCPSGRIRIALTVRLISSTEPL